MAISHKYTVICDDIRMENIGKAILIGVYIDNKISVPHVPATIPSLSFFQVYESDRPGSFTCKMRLTHMESGHSVVEGMGMMNVQRPGTGVAPIKFSPVQFPAFGTYNLEVRLENEPPIIVTFDVVNMPPMMQHMMRQPGQSGFLG
jgi:hypothetical protein